MRRDGKPTANCPLDEERRGGHPQRLLPDSGESRLEREEVVEADSQLLKWLLQFYGHCSQHHVIVVTFTMATIETLIRNISGTNLVECKLLKYSRKNDPNAQGIRMQVTTAQQRT